jgi:hypothetical protein
MSLRPYIPSAARVRAALARRARTGLRRLAPYRMPEPVFILAPPRSGSTFLFECLRRLPGLYSLGHEADPIWWDLFPYARMTLPSDFVGYAEASAARARALRRRLYLGAVTSAPPASVSKMQRTGWAPLRYLDKTIANCFHVEALTRMFPDAHYVLLVRDPRANISSMMEGWAYPERFGKPQLDAFIAKHAPAPPCGVRHWVYPAPPGWPAHLARPLEEVCAWSWMQHVTYALDDTARLVCPDRITRVRYEDLRADAEAVVRRLASRLGLAVPPHVAKALQQPARSRTTVSRPEPGKWRRLNGPAICRILPRIASTARRIGYEHLC